MMFRGIFSGGVIGVALAFFLTLPTSAATLVNRYSFTANADDAVGGAHGTLLGGAAVSGGAVVLNGSGAYVDLPDGLVSTLESATIEIWLTDTGSGTWSRIFDFGNGTSQYVFVSPQSGGGNLRSAITATGSGNEQQVNWIGNRLPIGVPTHVVWTVDAGTQTARLYVDGALVGENLTHSLRPLDLGVTVNNWLGRSQFGGDPYLNAAINEFRIYDGAMTAPEVSASNDTGPDNVPFGPVAFGLQPQSQTVGELTTATFTTTFGGTPPVGIQWRRNGVNIAGATNSTLSVFAALTNHNAAYSVVLTNAHLGTPYSVTSTNAGLSVTADTTPPGLVSAASLLPNEVWVTFSEGVSDATGTNAANYAITRIGGSLAVTAARFGDSKAEIILTTATQTVGTNYTLTVNNVRDRAAAANLIAANSQANFIATPFINVNVGNPDIGGSQTVLTNGLNVTAAGTGISGTSDQFTFSFQNYTNNFDVRVRVAGLSLVDAWTSATLMARNGLATNAMFAASVATPGAAGIHFESRTSVGGNATMAGSFPVNYPDTWLRLRRVGNVFDGFASLNGSSWAYLGSSTITMSNVVQVGFALASANASTSATAQFRDYANASGTITTNAPLPFEPLGPSSRRTGLVISEIMYHPADAPGFGPLEFVELYNSDVAPEDLSGYRLTGSIDYTFPPGTILPSSGFIVIARDPAAVESYYGISGVLGPFENNLPNDAGLVRLRNELNSVLLEVNYEDNAPWPVSADGAGHSLVLRRPSYGEDDSRAWAASDVIGGSPGRADGYGSEPLRGVVFNEILAHTDFPELDSVELFNPTDQPVNLAGYILTDDPATNKYVIGNVTIPARGFVAFTELDFPFNLDTTGEAIYLKNPGQTRVIDAYRWDDQENGVSLGRHPDGGGQWYRLATKTFGAANSLPRVSPVVINEIMYHPISGDDELQYIELHNRTGNSVNLSGWKLNDGVNFSIPTNTVIPANGYLVIAKNVAQLVTNYPNLNFANTLGNFSGRLSHKRDRIALSYPDVTTQTNNGVPVAIAMDVVVDEVTYHDGGRWGQWSDGGGSSLELMDPRTDKRFAANWADSDESAKAPWTLIEHTDLATLGMSTTGNGAPTRLEILLQGAGECLIDDVEVRSNGGTNYVTNAGFESGPTGWAFQGTHNRTTVELGGAFNGSRALRLRATGDGDTGANRIRTAIASLPVNGGNEATIRARVRWLRGDPNILLRIRGQWLECPGVMTLPTNLGTPGAANSRLVANASPAIADVTHTPVLPAAGQPVVVSARVSDPDGLASVQLRYRVDPNATYTTVNMTNAGGIYRGVIPGQISGAMVAFVLSATDANAFPAATAFPGEVFPPGAPPRECLVRFGEAPRSGSLGAYRLWLTQANIDYWTTREKQSSDRIDGTFVYGNSRAIYNTGSAYSGSPFHTPIYNGPLGAICNYLVRFPSDDAFLGSTDFLLQGQGPTDTGTFGPDATAQSETIGHWMGRKIGVRPANRRDVLVYVNGQQRGMIYWDYQKPRRELIQEFFPDDAEGQLHYIDDWFEFNDAADGFSSTTATLQDFTVNGTKRAARYRWTWEPTGGTAPNSFADLFSLVDAVNAPTPEPMTTATATLMNVPQWARMFALQHMAGNWDTYGYERGKNMYAYKPENGPWELLLWDMQLIFGKTSRSTTDSLFSIHDPVIANLLAQPPFRREYWRAFEELVNGPMAPENYGPLMDARVAALRANAVPVQDPTSIKNWIAARRSFILPQIPQADFSVAGPASFSSPSNYITLTGTAPIAAAQVVVNGAAYPLIWTGVTSWSLRIPLTNGVNSLTVTALDRNGNVLSNGTSIVTVTSTASPVAPEGNVVFNEIMYAPAADGAKFVELFNTHSNYTFDLSNWRVNGLGYTFPAGATLPPRSFLVLAENSSTFANTYGATTPVFDQYSGTLDKDGETLTLFRPSGTNEIVVDRVRYEPTAPWPAPTYGVSLQLVDAAQDNSRVANWALAGTPANPPPSPLALMGYSKAWRYNQTANLDGVNWTSPAYNDAAWPAGAGLLAFDNNAQITPLTGTVLADPRTGAGLTPGHAYYFRTTVVLSNNPAGYAFTAGARIDDGAVFYVNGIEVQRVRMNASATITNRSLATGAPPSNSDAEVDDVFVIPASAFTLGSNVIAVSVHQATTNSSDIVFGLQLNADYVGTAPATPGLANNVTAPLPPFPPLWLNELQANNVTGPFDNFGQRDPWLEIFNTANTNVSLAGYYLTDTYTNLTKWPFPGSANAANGFTLVWCDNQTNQTAAGSLHAGLVLAPGNGRVVLTRVINSVTQVLDYLNYTNLPANWSYGSVPDAQPFYRRTMFFATPGATNSGASAPIEIYINEWLADNFANLPDPADDNFEDWFELYNPGTNAVDLGGYYLTDTLAEPFKFQVPNNGHYVVPPGGYLLVWADNETGQNSTNQADLHVNFALSKGGEALGIFAADGTAIDVVTFGPQTTDVTEGRFPDGAANIYSMPTTTPRAANIIPNSPPTLAAITNRFLTLGQTLNLTAVGADSDVPAQSLNYSLTAAPFGANIGAASGTISWTPASAPSTNQFTVVVADNGTPSLSATQSFTVIVVLPPTLAGATLNGSELTLSWWSVPGQMYQVEYKDDLNDPEWEPLGSVMAGTGGQLSITNDLSSSPQRFFRLRVLTLAQAVLIPPMLEALPLNQSQLVLCWSTLPGQQFQVEYKNQLVGGKLAAAGRTARRHGRNPARNERLLRGAATILPTRHVPLKFPQWIGRASIRTVRSFSKIL
jgi:hypothetical protein